MRGALTLCVILAALAGVQPGPARRRFPQIFRTARPGSDSPAVGVQYETSDNTIGTRPAACGNDTAPHVAGGESTGDRPPLRGYLRRAAAAARRARNSRTVKTANVALRNIWQLANSKLGNINSKTTLNGLFGLVNTTDPFGVDVRNGSTAAAALRRGPLQRSWLPGRIAYHTDRLQHRLQHAVARGLRPNNNSSMNSTQSFLEPARTKMATPRQLAGSFRSMFYTSIQYAERFLDKVTADAQDGNDEVTADEVSVLEAGSVTVNVSEILDVVVPFAQSLVGFNDTHWQMVSEKNGIKVSRCISPCLPSGAPSKWPCYRASTLVNATPTEVSALLFDSSKVRTINRYSAGRTDVEVVDTNTKIVHNRILDIVGVRKPHDFCTLLHVDYLPDGLILLLSVAVNHTEVPISKDYLRSKILFGLNVMKPIHSSDPNSTVMTEVTSISHVQYSSVSPYIVSYSMPFGMYSFMLQLKSIFSE